MTFINTLLLVLVNMVLTTTPMKNDKKTAEFDSNCQKKRNSWSWKYFLLSKCEGYVKCLLCNTTYTYCNSTTMMNNHLNSGKKFSKIYIG
jgi:hypothetical protein